MRTAFLLLFVGLCHAQLVQPVRELIARKDFASAERLIGEYEKARGRDPESILAYSWLGRGAQAAKDWDAAARYAAETRKLCLEALKTRKLDDEPRLPTALGASIEVQGHTLAGQGQRDEAVAFLRKELAAWRSTSMRTRIQKNLNLIDLEGKPAPEIEIAGSLGPVKAAPLRSLKGKPYVLFFWAHWCADCKRQGPILARLEREFAGKGLTVVGPTQKYGYVAGGREATAQEELEYIEQVRRAYYSELAHMAVPVSEENFKAWGCSSSPTLALVDKAGIVRLFHPGAMSYEELLPHVKKAVGD
ncbi:MAG: TlpA disulfide reductase family protein [Bryobacteraceae bacterium]